MQMLKRLAAEALGTGWLVLGGCGSAVLALGFPDVGIGLLGVSLAFGLALASAIYALGPVSGGHFNPAVTLGLVVGGRFPARELPGYVLAQVLGALAGAGLLYLIASGKVGFDVSGGLGANGYAEHSPGGYGLRAALLAEAVMSFLFVFTVLSVTASSASAAVAPLAIGMALVLVHLIGIPLTATSVNPARSTGPALIVGGWALQQLWLFWVAPLLGGIAAGAAWRWFSK
jgi:aquaporin Z